VTMQLNGLPADLAQFVDDVLASGKYQSAEDLVCQALQVLQQQDAACGTPPPSDVTEAPAPPQSPEDYLQALAHALRTGEFGRARQVAMEGAARYPAHAELQKCAHVLAPPTVRAVPASAASRASVQANHAWMHAHWQDYRGQWVAVRDGQFVHAAPSFDDLVAHVGDTHGVLLTKIH
jgi:Arc/MetJ-type ribon-helix-helix transcriptional regulator